MSISHDNAMCLLNECLLAIDISLNHFSRLCDLNNSTIYKASYGSSITKKSVTKIEETMYAELYTRLSALKKDVAWLESLIAKVERGELKGLCENKTKRNDGL